MQTYKLDEVFGISRELPLNYASRPYVDDEFLAALNHSEHIVVFGTSKQGKTSLRKKHIRPDDHISLICSNRWNLPQLHSAILKAVGYTVAGTQTYTVTGGTKVSAKLSGGVRGLLFNGNAEAGAEADNSSTDTYTQRPLELDPEDVNDIMSALDFAGAPRLIVLDDFHYLPEETQRDFAIALKAFYDESPYQFLLSGVWLDENRLIQHNGDLGGRVTSINADRWDEDELRAVVSNGQKLLNIRFDAEFISTLVTHSSDSVWVVQDACRRACRNAQITETVREARPKLVSGDPLELVQESVNSHSARFNGFITRFADGFQGTRLEMYRWILYSVLLSTNSELERGITLASVTKTINEKHPEAPINAGNITQALASAARLQTSKINTKPIILDYDQTDLRLNVVDRTFLIWLEAQDRDNLLTLIGV